MKHIHAVLAGALLAACKPTGAAQKVEQGDVQEKKLAVVPAQVVEEKHEVGPFGFWKGMTVQELEKVGNMKPGPNSMMYELSTAPKPHDAFETYLVIVHPTSGLCKAVGIGKNIEVNSYGLEVRSEFDALSKALTEKYGKGKHLDFLYSGSIWNEPNDWMMGLLKNERTLMAKWSRTDGLVLPSSIHTIGLTAKGVSRSKAYVNLGVEFDNFKDCSAMLEKLKNDAL